jgi:Flp pilus assembly protein CpaB
VQLATKLVSTRKGTLIAALLIALLAGASILLYLNSYRDNLEAQGAPVTVLVAKGNIPKGTAGSVVASKDLYTVTTIRESQLLEGAISDPATLRDRVATREIFEGAQLTATDFGAAGDSLAAQLTDRERIVSVPLDGAHGLIGGIEVGNRVDVYAGFNVVPLGPDGRPINGGQARPMLRQILADVPVVAVGDPARGSGSTNVSLAVDDVKAAKLAFASDNGKVWLALRPSAGAKSAKPGIVTIETMLLGVPPVQVLRSVGGRP